jgi:hypothetical protein
MSELIRNFMIATGMDPTDEIAYAALADVMERSTPAPEHDKYHAHISDSDGRVVLNFDRGEK